MASEETPRGHLSRRRFLQGTTSGTVATIVMGPSMGLGPGTAVASSQGAQGAQGGASVQFDRSWVPILYKADAVVIGGSVAGIAAALEFARHGRKVVLTEHRNYLGREVSATLRPWVALGKLAGEKAPEPIAACLKQMGNLRARAIAQLEKGFTERGTALNPRERESLQKTADIRLEAAGGELPLWMDAFKVSLEDLLLDSGVTLVYASLPTRAIVENGAIRGVVIGNKSGQQGILGRIVLDTTSTALVARLAGAQFEAEKAEDYRFTRMIEMDGVGPLEQTTLTVPAELGIAGNKLTVHYGYRGKQHVLIECPMELQLGKMDMEGAMRREIEARQRTMRTASYLIQNVPAFKAGLLGICSYELDGLQTTRLAGPAPSWAQEFKGSLSFSDKNLTRVSLQVAELAGPVKGLWCLNEAARLDRAGREMLLDPVNASLAGAAFAGVMLPRLAGGEISQPVAGDYQVPYDLPHSLRIKHQDSPQRGRAYDRLNTAPLQVPVLHETDVLVVGGGTSGATCAAAAGREGVKTTLLELCPGLGGTATVGGVSAHWYGRYWAGFVIRTANLVDEVHRTINWPTSANKLNGAWNIEAKMYALLKDARDAGVEVFFNTTTFAAIVRDNQVAGVVSATPYGPMAVLAKVTADTTGDGDVAAFAGAPHFYGAARDRYPMWYNLAQYPEPTRSRWHFMHTVDVANVDDYTRAILIGRRRGPVCHDHGCYISTRESRHILGDVVVTLTDLLKHRQYPDVVNLGAGQMDCHRRLASDWPRTGLLFPILATEMPYRALLPQGLDNILVAGKAFSGSHDALYTLRNQPELENLGGAVAVAAACAVRDGVTARHVNLAKVQKRLTEIGSLLPEMLTRQIKEEALDAAAVRTFAKELDGRHLSAWEDVQMAKEGEPNYRKKMPFVEICTADPSVAVPILEEEYAACAAEDRKLRLAQALAFHGSKTGVPALIGAIEKAIATGMAPPPPPQKRLPVGQRQEGVPQPPSDLVYSLATTRDRRAMAVWDKLADLIKAEPEDFEAELPWPFHFVDSICYGTELLGDPAAIPILKKIHSRPNLRNQSAKKGFQVDFNLEKRALTEVTLARALAALGDAEGYETLIEYLDDNRASLAEFAHMTLEELSGSDNGKNPQAWRQWLVAARGSLRPIPLLRRVDG